MHDLLSPAPPPPFPPGAESDRGLRYAAFLNRLVAREAERDDETGLTAAEATAEWAYRARARYAYHRRVASPHHPRGQA